MQSDYSLLVMFTLGLFSSFHCIGMCGGIIGALSLGLDERIKKSKLRLLLHMTAYNTGRLTSYSIVGLILGAVGMTLVGWVGMGLAHQITRTLSALVMIIIGLYLTGWFPQFSRLDGLGVGFWKKIQPIGRHFLPVKYPWQAFGFGMVWGWIPCGLVYSALLLTATSGDVVHGGLGMLAFGLGTLPAVMGTGLATQSLGQWLKKGGVRQTFGLILIGLGILIFFIPMDHTSHYHPGSYDQAEHHSH